MSFVGEGDCFLFFLVVFFYEIFVKYFRIVFLKSCRGYI